jgi:hypothetical protein
MVLFRAGLTSAVAWRLTISIIGQFAFTRLKLPNITGFGNSRSGREAYKYRLYWLGNREGELRSILFRGVVVALDFPYIIGKTNAERIGHNLLTLAAKDQLPVLL